ncbi:MAG: hypothetical protein ACJAZY_001110 [Spirosomataceae bacterium]|jgi:hypothetical protein
MLFKYLGVVHIEFLMSLRRDVKVRGFRPKRKTKSSHQMLQDREVCIFVL